MASSTLTRSKQSWSIIIFTYNEKGSLSRVIQKVQKVLIKISNPRHEIIIVDDGSSDGSEEVIRAFQKKDPRVRAVIHERNLGIGRALLSGYAAARYENVCAVPGDGQFDVNELLTFPRVEPHTFVSFFRKLQTGYSLYRRGLSAFNRLVNEVFLGFNLEDVNWVKIYKTQELRKLDLQLKSSLVESEICAKLIRRGATFIQTPSVYHPRTAGVARGGGLKTVLKALFEVVRLARVLKGEKR
jgi:glycosyltransferase involved in cell wall biosynthesis